MILDIIEGHSRLPFMLPSANSPPNFYATPTRVHVAKTDITYIRLIYTAWNRDSNQRPSRQKLLSLV